MPRPHLSDYYCRKCGKIFYPYPDHRYKDRRGMYCSWTCFNHRNDGVAPPPTYREVEMLDEHGNVLQVFPSLRAAADHVCGTEKNISEACRHNKGRKTKFRTAYDHAWRYANDNPNPEETV